MLDADFPATFIPENRPVVNDMSADEVYMPAVTAIQEAGGVFTPGEGFSGTRSMRIRKAERILRREGYTPGPYPHLYLRMVDARRALIDEQGQILSGALGMLILDATAYAVLVFPQVYQENRLTAVAHIIRALGVEFPTEEALARWMPPADLFGNL